MGEAKKPIEHWQALIDHINDTWKQKKRVDFNYPFVGRDFRDLRKFVKDFKVWGLMALWDAFLYSDNEWAKKTGYSINAFCACIVWLVDTPWWKDKSKRYENIISDPISNDILPLLTANEIKNGEIKYP